MKKEAEQALIEQIKDDPKAFAVLFDAHYRSIFNYVHRRLGDYDAAGDITSETFLKAFLNIDKFRWKGISNPIGFTG